MAWTVDNLWLQRHIEDYELLILDPRPTIRYLQGHIAGAVSLPTSKIFTTSLELRPYDQLATLFGGAGVNENKTVLVYDSYDGQNAAMLAWTLELLGHRQVILLSSLIEGWQKEGRPILYRPVRPEPRTMRPKPNPDIRATFNDVSNAHELKLLDLRSREEFEGKRGEPKTEGKTPTPHLPKAINIPWTSLLGSDYNLLRSTSELEVTFSDAGLGRDDSVVTYCSFGPRAAIGYVALRQLDFRHVKVYDAASQHLTAHQAVPGQADCVTSEWNLGQ